jgi:hypothetical protein
MLTNLTIISAVNNDEVLNSCLLGSPDLASSIEVLAMRGHSSAASAYNAGIAQAQGEYLVFVHQDVFLAEGWVAKFQETLEYLARYDPNWGVLGMWGMSPSGGGVGYLYCTAGIRLLGESFHGCKEVRSLDEVLLIIRKSSGLRFDEAIGGFHMYGTDICLEAERRGMKSYAISAFGIHNSNGYGMLPWAFWRSFFQMRLKWRTALPVMAPCAEITTWCWPVLRRNVVHAANLLLKRHKVGRRIPDPAQLYRELVAAGKVRPLSPATGGGPNEIT